jgi:hypothetical protein
MRDLTAPAPLDQPAAGPVEGATLVVEAPTAEEALADLHQQLGADARIIEVRRVGRGGIGGFFAREMVELHAAPGTPGTPAASAASAASAAPAAPAAPAPRSPSPASRLLREEADRGLETVDFATYLREQLSAAPTAPPATGSPSTHEALLERATAVARQAVRAATGGPDTGGVVDPATDRVEVAASPDPAVVATPSPAVAVADPVTVVTATVPVPADVVDAPGDTVDTPLTADVVGSELTEPAAASEPGPAWSVGALVKLGLPAGLVRSLEVTEPADDIAWTAALAAALRPVCRPLPSGRSLLVGPRARSVASSLGVPTTAVGQPLRSRAATVAAAVGSGVASRRWLDKVRGNRWIHVVVGGTGWRELLHLDPLAVSWASEQDVPEAVRLATELGLVLGAGPLGREVRRARPLDVALVVRDLLPTVAGGAPAASTDGGAR